ncbi:MAG: response regulator transcription factor, partial [Clostridia bacterium]|nr:response regulator transcription factor [Clostridia bacterium]
MARILIAEDEEKINTLIKKNLELVGHECFCAFDGEVAIRQYCEQQFDLIILDVMLPRFSGFEVMERIKDTPVIFVTARSGLNDRLKGLRLGADDYIIKPFEILELIERVNAVLRRTKKTVGIFEFDDIKADIDGRRVYKNGAEVDLTPKEFDLLEALILNRNLALSREKLIELVWAFDFDGDCRTVDT